MLAVLVTGHILLSTVWYRHIQRLSEMNDTIEQITITDDTALQARCINSSVDEFGVIV